MDFDKTCLISKDLEDNNKKIRFMYKEKPYKEVDSGWRFFSGNATQEYVDNADNLLLVTLNYVINNIDSSVEKYLNSQIGNAYERENVNDDFVKSNFNFEAGE